MNALFLKEQDVEQLVSVREVIEALDAAFREQASGRAFTNPRNRLRMPGVTLHMMAGGIPGYFGYKAYTVGAGKARFLFYLFSAETTDLLAIMEADRLGQIRTGAATGLATRILSNPDASEAVLFGAGWQAQSQLLALDAVRSLTRVAIVNRNAERLDSFISTMQPQVNARLVPAGSAEEAVRSSHIVTTMTTSRDPVFKGEWLQPGVHINAAGSNALLRRELDDDTVMRANLVVVDSIEQARIEVGEFLAVIETGRRHWEDFAEFRDVVAGLKPGRRNPSDITLFKSQGLAIEDLAIGKLVYERAVLRGLGHAMNL